MRPFLGYKKRVGSAKGITLQNDAHVRLAQLSEDALQTLILELGRYALSVSRRLYWRTGDAVELPRGETIDSIVSLAFTKVLTGERRWRAAKEPDLKTYLMSVIDSLLNHLAEHSDNRMLRAMPEEGQPEAMPTTPARNPEMALLQQEKERHAARVMQLLLEVSQDDPLVLRTIESMRDGCEKPADIATTLGVPVSDVYNAIKRLERKMIRVRQRLQAPQGRG